MLTAKFNMDFESAVEAAKTPVFVLSNDFMSVSGEISLEQSMLSNDISNIEYQHEMMAIEAYREANGDSEAIESELNIIREASEKTIWERIKEFISKMITKIKELWARFKNWITGLFVSNDKLIDKFGGRDLDVTAELYDIEKAIIFFDKINENGQFITSGSHYLKGFSRGYILACIDVLMTGKEVKNVSREEHMNIKVEDLRKAVYESALGEKKERTVKAKDLAKFLIKYKVAYRNMDKLYNSSCKWLEQIKNAFRSEDKKVDYAFANHLANLIVAFNNTTVSAVSKALNNVRQVLRSVDVREESYEPEVTTEGWAMLIPFINIPLAVIGINNVDKIVHNPKVEKYIESKCKEILAEEKKRDKSVTKDMPPGLINAMARNIEGNQSLTFKSSLKNVGVHTRVKGFYCVPYGDTDHLEGVSVVLYSENRDKFIARRIPAPTKQELKDLGFKEED